MMWKYIFIWMAAWSVVAWAAMAIDKRRAKNGGWRVPEKTLFLFAAIGGSPGALAGMWMFRHKTKHKSFTIGLPAILLVQLAALAYIYFR